MKMLHNNAVRDAGEAAGASAKEVLAETARNLKLIRTTAESLYLDELKRVGIQPARDYPPPFSENGHADI